MHHLDAYPAKCGELASVVAIEQNNNYIELGTGFQHVARKLTHWRKKTALAAGTVGQSLLNLPSGDRIILMSVESGEKKLQFLQSYCAGRCFIHSLMAELGADMNLHGARTSLSGFSALQLNHNNRIF